MADLKIGFKIAVDSAGAQAAFGRFAAEAKASLTSVATTANQTDTALKSLGVKSTTSLKAELGSLKAAYATVATSGSASLADIRAATAALKQKTAELNAALSGGQIGQFNQQISAGAASQAAFAGWIGQVAHKMLALAAGLASVRQALSVVQGIVQTGAAFETFGVQLNTLYGDSAKAESAMGWIKQFTQTTPFQLEGVTQGFIKLKAFGLDPMDGTMQAIADQSAALGGSQEKLSGIVLALGQAWTKQKLQGDEILQLINQGVPVWDLLAKVTGKNTAELHQMSQAGLLGREVIRGLIDEMGKVNAGAAAKQMQTFNGQLSNLKDSWTQFQNTIAESGLLDYLKAELDQINTRISEMAASGELKAYAQQISSALIGAAQAVKSFATELYELRHILLGIIELWAGFKALKIASATIGSIRALIARAQIASGALKGMGTEISTMGGTAAGASPLLRALSLIRIAAPVGLTLYAAELFRLKANADASYETIQRLNNTKINALHTTADINAGGVGTKVLSAADLAKQTGYEQSVYAENLRQAQAYYAAMVEAATRGDKTITEAQAAENLAQKHAYDQALADLKQYQTQRGTAESAFNARLSTIKAQQTAIIEKALADQLRKYQAANAQLKKLQDERANIEQQFDQTAGQVNKQPAPDFLDIYGKINQAKGQLSDGDAKSAANSAEQARQLIEAASAAGSVSDYFLKDFLSRAKQVALDANTAQQADTQKQIDGYQASIDALKGAAEFLKTLPIGFDVAGAEQSAADLQAKVQALLSKNPLVIPVVLQKPDTADGEAGNIIQTGGLNKPSSSSSSTPGYATGGYISGAGTGTSDSILARLSNGEFVVRAAAVRNYGADFLHRINRLRLPKFASGGLIGRLAIPRLPSPAGTAAQSSGDTIFLNLPSGQKIGPMNAAPEVSATLKQAALMFGVAR